MLCGHCLGVGVLIVHPGGRWGGGAGGDTAPGGDDTPLAVVSTAHCLPLALRQAPGAPASLILTWAETDHAALPIVPPLTREGGIPLSPVTWLSRSHSPVLRLLRNAGCPSCARPCFAAHAPASKLSCY